MAESPPDRLRSLAATTLWPESPERRRRRALQLAVLTPFGIVAGGAYGVRATPPGAETWPLALLSIAGVLLFVWLQGVLLPLVRRGVLGAEEEGRAVFDFVWEGAVGALVVLGATRVLETPPVASAGMATAVGGFLAWGLAGLAGGRGIEAGLSAIFGWRGGSAPRPSDLSAVHARAVRGDLDGALRMLQDRVTSDPGDPLPYRTAARVLEEAGRPEEAAGWLRRARSRARMEPAERIRTARRSAELVLHGLGRPARAAPDLAWIVEHADDGPDRAWAERELRRAKEAIERA